MIIDNIVDVIKSDTICLEFIILDTSLFVSNEIFIIIAEKLNIIVLII